MAVFTQALRTMFLYIFIIFGCRMLVNLGDLPRPDQGVLSETLWQSKQSMNPPPPQNHNGSLDQAKSSNALQKRGIDDKVKTENNIGKKPKLDSLFSK